MRTRLAYAGFGVLATITGMATGHLVAALTDPAASPVLAVGSSVIDLTPTPVKEWAVANFGTNDKPILIGSVLLGALVLAALAGMLARRRFAVGAGLLLGLVAVAAAAALTRPTAVAADLVPSLAAALLGVGLAGPAGPHRGALRRGGRQRETDPPRRARRPGARSPWAPP